MGKAVLFPNFRGIPEHVQAFDRWIVWKEERRVSDTGAELWTKVPYVAGDLSRHASTSDKSTWRSFARTKAFYLGRTAELAGIGFCRADNHYFFDGDNFFRDRRDSDPRYGHEYEKYNLACNEWDWAGKQPIEFYQALRSAGAWMEISCQHYGLHAVVASATIVPGWQKAVPGLEHTGMALYTGNRYLAVTGACLSVGDLNLDSWQLLEEIGLWVPQQAAPNGANGGERAPRTEANSGAFQRTDLSDEEVIRLVRRDPKGGILWNGGDPGGLGDSSPSGLDLALCCKIVFYGGRDPARVDRIFRESALYREKWEREDYRERTIAAAIETVTQLYAPRAKAAKKAKAHAAKAGSGANATGGGSPGAERGDEPPEPPAGFTSASESASGEEAPKPNTPAWKDLLLRHASGKAVNCHANADIVFRFAPEWERSIVLDEFALVIRTLRDTPWFEAVSSWQDEHNTRAAIWMQRQGVPCTPNVITEVVYAMARENRTNPLREWLDSLVWDNEPRIDRWLSTYLGAPENNYTALAGAWWLGQAVVRAFHPGSQADYTLVLEGPQGQKKSQALRALAGDEYFTDQISDFSNKDSSLDLQGKWIIEIAEFDRIAHKPSVIKAFLTRMTDRFRPPYGTHPLEFPRQVIFAATVNLEEYFADDTGNRRFWPVQCGYIDTDALAADREQLWAEAVERFWRKRARRWPSEPEELKLFGAEQAQREELDVWHDQIAAWVDNPSQSYDRHGHPLGTLVSVKKKVTVADILTHCLQVEAKNQNQAMKKRVAGTLKRLGWKAQMSGKDYARYRAWVLEDTTNNERAQSAERK